MINFLLSFLVKKCLTLVFFFVTYMPLPRSIKSYQTLILKPLKKHQQYRFKRYRIMLFSILIIIIGIYSFNVKGQTVTTLTIDGGPVSATLSTPGEEHWYKFYGPPIPNGKRI